MHAPYRSLSFVSLALALFACRPIPPAESPANTQSTPSASNEIVPPVTDAARDVLPAPFRDAQAVEHSPANTPVDASADTATNVAALVRCTRDEDCRSLGRRTRCFTNSLSAQYTQSFHHCSNARTWQSAHPTNTCIVDECSDAADSCPEGQRCGTFDMVHFPQRICLPALCTNDAQCRRESGGHCASFLAAGHCSSGGWACSYPSDPCAPRDPVRRCPIRPNVLPFCAPANDRFRCVEEPVVANP